MPSTPSQEGDWMVVRSSSFKPYWAEPVTFGPMPEAEARAMAAMSGPLVKPGHAMPLSEFMKAGFR